MPNAIVPSDVIDLGTTGLVSGAPVVAADWRSIADSYDAIDGMGSVLVPFHVPAIDVAALGTFSLPFTSWPRYQATHRLWAWSLITKAPTSTSLFKFTNPSGGSFSFTGSFSPILLTHIETLSAQSAAETRVTATIQDITGGGGTWTVIGIGCFELPRPGLVVASSDPGTADAGMDQSVATSGLPIADSFAGVGAAFVGHALDGVRDTARRTGLFAATTSVSTTSATFAAVFQSPPIVLTRGLYRGVTSGLTQVAIEATIPAGTVGEARITMASGAVVTVALVSQTTRTQIAIDAEDITASDGRRSTRNETVTIEVRRVSGAGTVVFLGATGGEGTAASVALISPPARYTPPRFGRGPLPHWMSRKKRTR